MKGKTKIILYGIFIMVVTLVSVLPLGIVDDISEQAFFYAVVSWALGILIGINLMEFLKMSNEIKKDKLKLKGI